MSSNDKKLGLFFLFLFVILIFGGVIAKRVYGHPDWMMLFHLPAAVFLVMGMRQFNTGYRKEYEREVTDYQQNHDVDQGNQNQAALK